MKNRLIIFLLAAVAMIGNAFAATEVIYYHNDLTGSPLAATDASGSVVWRESYRPYGERLKNEAGAQQDKIWFTSRHQDADTGLIYMGARYYDPALGRFLSTDPVRFKQQNIHSFNRYAYANNSPQTHVDPDGRTALHLGRFVGQGSFTIATRLGAGRLGSWIARTLADAIEDYGTEQILVRKPYVISESNGDADKGQGTTTVPPVPTDIVGSQDDERAGENKSGGKHTSGPLRPEHGGTGDFDKDLEKLTGGTRPWQPGDKAPPGSLVGGNGIFGRPKNSSGGQSIDIPANGSKPHETLHYP